MIIIIQLLTNLKQTARVNQHMPTSVKSVDSTK